MKEMEKCIKKLLAYGVRKNLVKQEDVIYVRNRLLDALGKDDYTDIALEKDDDVVELQDLLDDIKTIMIKEGKLQDTQDAREKMDARLMDCLTPPPSAVIERFQKDYAQDPRLATDHYYEFSKDTNYICRSAVKKDKKWSSDTIYGSLDITINLSKPEKDPKDIAKAKLLPPSIYPRCLLCKENEGYAGHLNHPARNQHRIIPITLDDQTYYMQYSPYSYYNEHCILLNEEHIPMSINRHTFQSLFDFVDYLPHYFIGSNADLPIVGGSILTHDHFQGGNYHFAMEKASVKQWKKSQKFAGISYGILHWMVSTIRAQSSDKKKLIDFACHVLNVWKTYSDEKLSILASSGEVRHNTITPIVRKHGELYEIDLVLRNNRCDENNPDGIFHPHKHLHHIKKENIGLIEVMGLAILPSRLLKEMELLKKSWMNNEPLDASILKHEDWFHMLKKKYPDVSRINVDEIIKKEIGYVFLEVLEDAGVFKQTASGQDGFEKFLNTVEETL